MARKYVGLPFGAMIALCAILLLAPDSRGQTVTKKKFTITGSVGLAGVTLSGFPGPAVKTDDNGMYTATVEYGWGGTVIPQLKGYTFEPASKKYEKVVAALTDQDYKPQRKMFVISGSVMPPMADVEMTGFPDKVVTDAAGKYTTSVPMGWGGTVTPKKTAYQFEPPSRPYTDLAKAMPDQSYKAADQMIVIAGTTGVQGAKLSGAGLPANLVSGPKGVYTVRVKYGWSGKITPVLEGYEFVPAEKEYANLTEDQKAQDFTARQFMFDISGSTGMAGVTMKGFPGDAVLTDAVGLYKVSVPWGWTGTVVPERPGYTFNPKTITFPKVTAAKENQDFAATMIRYTISGDAGAPEVTLAGLPGDPVSDARGQFRAEVDYGWSGTIMPKKDGYNFTPDRKDFPNPVTQNQTNVSFKAAPILFKISGNVGQAQVVIKLSPAPNATTTSVVSGAGGEYSFEVPYNWKGTVTPQKIGYSFDPNTLPYDGVLAPLVGQNFTPKIMQCSLVGKITGDDGQGVPDVMVLADPADIGSTTTDTSGAFEIKVNYGTKLRLTFQKAGCLFNPVSKTFDVTQPTTSFTVAGKVQMMTITDKLMASATEPLAEVKITASPGNIPPVMTDLKGVYKIQVPYGWSGDLKFEKEGFEFNPDTKSFTNVTEDWENGNPKPKAVTPPPVAQPPVAQPPVTQPPITPPPTTQPPTGQPSTTPPATTPPAPSAKDQRVQQLEQEIATLNEELNKLRTQINDYQQKGVQVPAELAQQFSDTQAQISRKMNERQQVVSGLTPTPTPTPGPTAPRGPRVPDAMSGKPLLTNVLNELSKNTGVVIATDATVKPDPVNMDLSRLEGLPIPSALQMLVNSTPEPYAFRSLEDGKSYEVFRPISNTFQQTRLDQALRDIANSAGVPIAIDPNISGDTSLTFDNLPFEEALQLLLAGKPYVFKKTAKYYLVAPRGITKNESFMDISETRRVRLNYTQPARVKALLSPIFAPYVQAEQPNPRDPNDQGNILLITAAPEMVDRIVEDIKQIDRYKRQVLLDARVVAMERGNLLNLGVEWSWPTVQAGAFADRSLNSTTGLYNNNWLYGVQMGYTPDRSFTNSLMAALNLLEQNSQADIIAKPQVVSQDNARAEMRVIQEQWFMMTTPGATDSFYTRAELQKIESGTVLSITPHIGDNNDITLEMAVEVSDSIPKARGSDLPLVTRRTSKNRVVVHDGGTVAVSGLTETRSKTEEKRVPGLSSIPLLGQLFTNRNNDKASREVAVFVTARLVPEGVQVGSTRAVDQGAVVTTEQPAGDEYQKSLEQVLANQNR